MVIYGVSSGYFRGKREGMYGLQKRGLYRDYMFSIVLIAAAPYSDFCSSVRSSSPTNSPTLDTRVSRMVE